MKNNIKKYSFSCFVFFALFIIALLVYGPCLKGPFIWDDLSLIKTGMNAVNLPVGKAGAISKPFSFFFQALYPASQNISSSFYYRPFQAFSYYLDYKVWGFNAFGYHMSNVLIHSLNALMIYFLLARFLCGRGKSGPIVLGNGFLKSFFSSRGVPVLMAALFLVHPISVTSVAYIAGRADLLACFFILLGLLFLDGLIWTKKRVLYATCMIVFFAALLSKESAVLAPFIFIAYFVFRSGDLDRLGRKIFFPLIAGFCIVFLFYFFLRAGAIDVSSGLGIPAFFSKNTVPTLLKMICGYIGLFFFPYQPHLGRVLALESSFLTPLVLLSCLFLAGMFFLYNRWLRKSYGCACFGLAWFFLWVFPLSFFCILLGRLGLYVIMPENNLYVAGAGLLCVVGFFLNHLFHAHKKAMLIKWVYVVIGLYIFSLAVVTWQNSKKWSSDIVFYEYLLEVNSHKPSASLIYKNLALVYKRQGDYEKAIENYKLALRWGQDADVYHNLGNIYFERDELALARLQYLKAIHLNPRLGCSYIGLGLVFLRQGDIEKAKEMFVGGLKISPDDPRLKAIVLDVLYPAAASAAIKPHLFPSRDSALAEQGADGN